MSISATTTFLMCNSETRTTSLRSTIILPYNVLVYGSLDQTTLELCRIFLSAELDREIFWKNNK